MTAWIGLGSAEGVQPANGTTMLPTVETVVRWQTKANMDNHPKTPYFFTRKPPPVFGKRKRDHDEIERERRKSPKREMEKQKTKTTTKKKTGKKLQGVRGLRVGMSIDCIITTELYCTLILLHSIHSLSLVLFFFFFFHFLHRELDR